MSQLYVLFVGAFVTGQWDQPRLCAPGSVMQLVRAEVLGPFEKYQNIRISEYQTVLLAVWISTEVEEWIFLSG